jgi:hypothetical protein
VPESPRPLLQFSVIQGKTGIPRIGTVFAFFLSDTGVDTSTTTFHAAVGMKMSISPHQVNNVLRVYGDQLCHSRTPGRPEAVNAGEPERITISAKAWRETIIEVMTSNIIQRITQTGPDDTVERETFKKLECEDPIPLAVNAMGHNRLLFKKIDGNAETVNSLSIEDSEFLINTLRVIISGHHGGKK